MPTTAPRVLRRLALASLVVMLAALGAVGCGGGSSCSGTVDDCGVCNGANSSKDCAGVCSGSAVLDDCGVCNGANASMDCAGVCGGAAVVDSCGVCGGSDASKDCAGVCGGTAVVDSCGVCGGNDASKDCAGVCGGLATVDGCGTCDANSANDCRTTQVIASGWSCAAGSSCQDVYDLQVPAGATLTVNVGSVTGASVLRLALFGPGVALSGTNLLTGVAQDRMCMGQNQADGYVFTVAASGTYRLAVGRDWGSSAGSAGTYQLSLASSVPFSPQGQTVNDSGSQASGTRCSATWSGTGGWSCASGVSCQDVYDVTLPAGTVATLAVSSVTGSSVPRLAAFAPGQALTSASLLTGTTSDRSCVSQNTSDSVTFKAPTTGTYRLAVGRDWGSSAGASGTYAVSLTADQAFLPPAQTASDAAAGLVTTRCGYLYTVAAGWTCASGVSCQDVYDLETLGPTSVTVAVSSVTGASVVRQAVVQGSSLTGTNLLNGGTRDRRCAAQNASDTAGPVSLTTAGQHRFAVGRDWGQSAGSSGTYVYTVTTTGPVLLPLGATVNDQAAQYAATPTCP